MAEIDEINFTAQTNPDISWILGRNGGFQITAVRVMSFGQYAYLDGIGRRGRVIRGGMRITAEAMDDLAQQWLESRGFSVSKTSPERVLNGEQG